MRRSNMTWLALAAAALPWAVQADDTHAALAACRSEADDARRLACYDRVADGIAGGPGVSPAATTPEERFGRRAELAREKEAKARADERELGELQAVVTEIWTRSDGLMRITLDNGQVWSQNAPDAFFRLKTGDKVKIQPAALGSYLLSGPSKRSTRVTRIE